MNAQTGRTDIKHSRKRRLSEESREDDYVKRVGLSDLLIKKNQQNQAANCQGRRSNMLAQHGLRAFGEPCSDMRLGLLRY